MPFTFAHPAAVLPFRKRLVFSALVIGSMAPDFRYFVLPLTLRAYESHTIHGIFIFCLPLGLLALWMFHRILKRPLLALFPESHQQRLLGVAGPFRFGPLPRFGLILASLALGSLTHIAWDGFTHGSGWAVARLPFLQIDLLDFHRHRLYVFGALQHGSSVAGLLILFFAYERWLRTAPVQPVDADLRAGKTAKIAIISAIVMLAAVGDFLERMHDTQFPLNGTTAAELVVKSGLSFMGLAFAWLFLFSIAWYCVRMNRRNSGRSQESSNKPVPAAVSRD